MVQKRYSLFFIRYSIDKGENMSDKKTPIKVTEDNFENLIKGNKPVLVDFFATWCGPCQMMLPVIGEIAEEAKDFEVATLDIDENPQIAAKYGVMSVPTFAVFKEGEEVARMLGAMPKEMVIDKMQEAIK